MIDTEFAKSLSVDRDFRLASMGLIRCATVALLAFLNLAVILSFFNIFNSEQRLDNRSIAHVSENMYSYPLHQISLLTPSDRLYDNYASRLVLYENDVAQGPNHSLLKAIGEIGSGRFSHWGNDLFFSSSDNSNPLTNGRAYKITYPISPPFYTVFFTFVPLIVAILGFERTVKHVVPRFVFVVIGIALVVGPFELFLGSEYAKLHLVGSFNNFPVRIQPTLNKKGYRDSEHSLPKPDDRARILILGDSMTFGWGIADDEIYPKLVADLAGPRAEIISLAQNGWSTADELVALQREGLSYQPDIVVIGVVTNDPAPPTTEPSGQQPEWVVFKRIPSNLQFFYFLDYYVNRFGDILHLKYTYSQWEEDIFDPEKQYRPQWERTVQDLYDLLVEKGVPAYAFILISPVSPQSDIQKRKYETLYEVFSKTGFNTINLHQAYLKEFRNTDEKSLWALPDDPHPGPAVNRLFAREIWKVLEPEVQRLSSNQHRVKGDPVHVLPAFRP